jgi:distribution and morphology protein 12
MSVDINWDTLTSGPDGEALAEKIRAFVHERFQHISLPKLIRSVKVHGFDFGKTAPEIVLKDICEPLPDFYENDAESTDDGTQEDGNKDATSKYPEDRPADRLQAARERMMRAEAHSRQTSDLSALEHASNPQLSRGTTPGFLHHGTSSLGYFNLPLGGVSGTNTPLAAVAGAHFGQSNQHGVYEPPHHQSDSFSSISPPPSITPPSRSISREDPFDHRPSSALVDDDDEAAETQTFTPEPPERSPEDMQVVFHVTYSGDVKLAMTAEVFLDYPMPSFVGIPLKLNITGLTFDGVGVLAYIKRKAHLCFLASEDAEALVATGTDLGSPEEHPSATKVPNINGALPAQHKVGGLIEDIRIESEMGGTDSGRQVLKNVDKIEKFILEQVQRIFEDECVYPSFWTFLV